MIRTVTATHYVTPLREGGSLPAIVEADDDGMYVVKFRGAGQGHRALVAELIAGELGRAAGLPVPEIVFVQLDPRFAKTEPDPEIQDLLRKSDGLNLGLDYLPGSITFDPLTDASIVEQGPLASSVVWLDAFVTNVDRTPRNTNLLVWHRKLWMIDHGASFYFHHTWDAWLAKSRAPFPAIRDHVLLRWASELHEVDEALARRVRSEIASIIEAIPSSWLGDVEQFTSVEEHRAAYRAWLERRLESPREWVEEAARARSVPV